jgi:hypothetical protein
MLHQTGTRMLNLSDMHERPEMHLGRQQYLPCGDNLTATDIRESRYTRRALTPERLC